MNLMKRITEIMKKKNEGCCTVKLIILMSKMHNKYMKQWLNLKEKELRK